MHLTDEMAQITELALAGVWTPHRASVSYPKASVCSAAPHLMCGLPTTDIPVS